MNSANAQRNLLRHGRKGFLLLAKGHATMSPKPAANDCSNDLHKPPAPFDASMLVQVLAGAEVEAQAHIVLSAKHLDRIRGSMLYAATSAMPYAILHERTFEHDVIVCAYRSGRLLVRVVIVNTTVLPGNVAPVDTMHAAEASHPQRSAYPETLF